MSISLIFPPLRSQFNSNFDIRNISYAQKENYLLKDDGICVIIVKKEIVFRVCYARGHKNRWEDTKHEEGIGTGSRNDDGVLHLRDGGRNARSMQAASKARSPWRTRSAMN